MSPGGGGEGGDELLNGQCMRRSIQIFLSESGGGVQAQRRENSLDFLCFLGFFSLKFSGDAGRGPTIYEEGSKC